MEYTIKLVGALPKGDPNGFEDSQLAEELADDQLHNRTRMRAAVVIYDVKDTVVGDEGVITNKVRVRCVQPVLTDAGRRTVEGVLRDEYAAQTGAAMLPFDVQSVTKAAFADLPRTPSEVDEEEERERENMSPHDELRRHLERAHGREDAHLLTDAEADHRHEADHDGDMPEMLQHDREWHGWTRADLEASEAESDGDPDGPGENGVILTPLSDSDEDERPAVPMAEFRP